MLKFEAIAEHLWGKKAKFAYLFAGSVLLIFTFLGARDIWTQEHRWADIVFGMFYRQDFLHPYLGEVRYYDKPLLSYWLIVATAKMAGILNGTILRFPTACAGLLAIWSTYSIGRTIKDTQFGLLAGWLLLTTFYFLFWARVSSADMLNMAGSLYAIAWYMNNREQGGWYNYSVFFVIVALSCLCKGLVSAIIVFIAVGIDMFMQRSFKQHLQWKLLVSALPGLIVYLFPFWLSSHFDTGSFGQNGLYLVYKENVLRYFKPFDHEGPIYTYLIYLPIYTLPWAIFLVPALATLKSRWQTLSRDSKWVVYTLLALFLFFSLSGSRRSYYVLPMVPFAILFIADWIRASGWHVRYAAGIAVISALSLFIFMDAAPAWFYSRYGASHFAELLKQDARGWPNYNVVLLDPESKVNFYLQLPPATSNYPLAGKEREERDAQAILKIWPVLANKPANTIFISRKLYAKSLKKYFDGYHEVAISSYPDWPFLKNYQQNAPIAFVPNK